MGVRAERTAATRQRIVDAASAMFLADGYQAASLRDLARRAGTSTTALYAHFRGKAELLAETLRERLRHFDSSRYFAQAASSGDPAEAQGAIAREYPERAALRRLLLEVASAAGADPDVREQMRSYFEDALDVWTGNIVDFQSSGDVDRALDGRAVAMHFAALEFGLSLFEAFGLAPPDPDAWADVTTASMRGMAIVPADRSL